MRIEIKTIVQKLVFTPAARRFAHRMVRGKVCITGDVIGSLKERCETVRPMRLALLQAGLIAEAVLTPQNKDLESGLWTRGCTAHEHQNIGETARMEEKNAQENFASNETQAQARLATTDFAIC